MRTLIVCLAAIAACTANAPPPPPAQPLTPAQVAPPADNSVTPLAGVVTSAGQGSVSLDSGGAKPVPLLIDRNSAIVVDGKPATAGDIREGDMVRAAYRMSDSGEPLAIELVVNSRPISARPAPPQEEAPAAAAPARAK